MKKYFSLISLAVGMILFGSATPVSKIIGLEISVFTAFGLVFSGVLLMSRAHMKMSKNKA